MIQGYIFGKPADAEAARTLANSERVEAEGYKCIREPRHRLMRRAITCIDDETLEVKLRNISSMGTLVDCPLSVPPGLALTIDIVGVGPVTGMVCWAQSGKFGLRFDHPFDLSRLAPKKEQRADSSGMRPWYVERRAS
jgi:hypothetical protein